MRFLASLLMLLGAVALGLLASVNLFEIMLTDEPFRVMFTQPWWGQLWPFYLVALAMVLVGFIAAPRRRVV